MASKERHAEMLKKKSAAEVLFLDRPLARLWIERAYLMTLDKKETEQLSRFFSTPTLSACGLKSAESLALNRNIAAGHQKQAAAKKKTVAKKTAAKKTARKSARTRAAKKPTTASRKRSSAAKTAKK